MLFLLYFSEYIILAMITCGSGILVAINFRLLSAKYAIIIKLKDYDICYKALIFFSFSFILSICDIVNLSFGF